MPARPHESTLHLQRRRNRIELAWVLAVLAAWTAVFGWRALAGHYSLRTNAYDLSVFDYALWNTLHGRVGFVPFFGYSIFSEHFMPILFVLLPLYALHQSAAFLIVLQTLAIAAAGFLFYRLARRFDLPEVASLALLLVFLVSRRSHGAAVSYFYPESLQPLLMFALVLCWRTARPILLWAIVVLLLMTKEDAALYVGSFAVLQVVSTSDHRARAASVFAVAAAWLVVAVFVAVPLARHFDGLPAVYPFWETRFAVADGTPHFLVLVARLVSWHSLNQIVELLLMVGFLPLLAPRWMIPAAAGLVVDLLTNPGTMQASFTGHYAWPILPWVFLSAAAGACRLLSWNVRLGWSWLGVLAVATVADAPVVRYATRIGLDPVAQVVRSHLPPAGPGQMLALPNLVPHLAHTNALSVLFAGREPPSRPDVVVLTETGDIWPFSPAEVADLIRRYQSDAQYAQRAGPPLFVFERRPQ